MARVTEKASLAKGARYRRSWKKHKCTRCWKHPLQRSVAGHEPRRMPPPAPGRLLHADPTRPVPAQRGRSVLPELLSAVAGRTRCNSRTLLALYYPIGSVHTKTHASDSRFYCTRGVRLQRSLIALLRPLYTVSSPLMDPRTLR